MTATQPSSVETPNTNGKQNVDWIINSGYPLQLGIEQLVKDIYPQTLWKVLTRELRWSRDEKEGYIDLVLAMKNYDAYRMVIECKRYDGIWNFLIPINDDHTTDRSCTLQSIERQNETEPNRLIWNFADILPSSDKASFCINSIKDRNDNRSLEKLCNELIMSMECFAIEELSIQPPSKFLNFYIPVLITTANLKKFVIDPQKVNLTNGSFDPNDTVEIPWIRFSKNLSSSLPRAGRENIHNMEEINKVNDRDIYVVQAKNFQEFLILCRPTNYF